MCGCGNLNPGPLEGQPVLLTGFDTEGIKQKGCKTNQQPASSPAIGAICPGVGIKDCYLPALKRSVLDWEAS